MGRYLMYISYIGKGFYGLQRQRLPVKPTIVGALEDALKALNPVNEIEVITSSRTDKGVNALCNTVHVDLVKGENEGQEFDPEQVTAVVNRTMRLCKHDIRVLKTLRVPDDFHSRFKAVSRTYVYRCAVCKKPVSQGFIFPHSPFEYQRTYLVYRKSIDVELLHKAAEQLSGTHDYSAFSNHGVLRDQYWVNPVKKLDVSIVRGNLFMEQHQHYCKDHVENFEFVFKANSFLFRQVRKMTAVMLAVASGQVDVDIIPRMLEEPKKTRIRKTDIFNIPSYGLYLTDVEYLPQDLIFPSQEGSTTPPISAPGDNGGSPYLNSVDR